MKSKELYNLFDEPPKDEIERRVVKSFQKEIKLFLNEMLGLLTAGIRIQDSPDSRNQDSLSG